MQFWSVHFCSTHISAIILLSVRLPFCTGRCNPSFPFLLFPQQQSVQVHARSHFRSSTHRVFLCISEYIFCCRALAALRIKSTCLEFIHALCILCCFVHFVHFACRFCDRKATVRINLICISIPFSFSVSDIDCPWHFRITRKTLPVRVPPLSRPLASFLTFILPFPHERFRCVCRRAVAPHASFVRAHRVGGRCRQQVEHGRGPDLRRGLLARRSGAGAADTV